MATPPSRHTEESCFVADHDRRDGLSGESAGYRPWTALGADILLVVLFAALGRNAHEASLDVTGVLGAAAPFVIALLVAALVTRLRRTWTQVWPAGVVVWLITVVGGLGLRVLVFGETAAVAFQLVAAGVLGVFLLGRRIVTALPERRRRARRS